MEAPTGYHERMVNIMQDIVNHGWGEVRIRVESLKDNSVKIIIEAGRSDVFFIKKDIRFNDDKIF